MAFPRHVGDIEIDPDGPDDYALVQWVEKPEHDPIAQRCEASTPVNVDGVWFMRWFVRQATAAEIEDAANPRKRPWEMP